MADKKYRKILVDLPKNPKNILPPLLYPAKTKTEEAWLTELKKKKRIRKIGPRLYTSVAKTEEKNLVRSQWSQIINHLYPEALLSHRSALEYKPSPENNIILTSTTNRRVEYPGLTLHFVRGPQGRPEYLSFSGFHASSTARAYLVNFSSTKATAWRSLSTTELEDKLETLLPLIIWQLKLQESRPWNSKRNSVLNGMK